MIDELVEQLKAEFKGYHLEIYLGALDGSIEVLGCQDCGTDGSVIEVAAWSPALKVKTASQAVKELKGKLGKNDSNQQGLSAKD